MPYRINYSPDAVEHVRLLRAIDRAKVATAVETHLRHHPTLTTRNRKPMRLNPIATWELRIEHLRVYYDVDANNEQVAVLAIGIKVGNRVRIGAQWFDPEDLT